jgi:serine/threonine protein kinase
VKPGNIIVDPSGKPYLMDFGLAKEIDAAFRITRPGMAMGTPAYMSPEQAEGDGSIDGRADVYSLGALLFEVLTGRPPFKGASLVETMMQVVSGDSPSIREHQPQVDPSLEAICMKCLQKDREKRYASAVQIAEDLESYLDGRAVTARPISFRERVASKFSSSKKRAFFAGALAIAGAAVFLLLL